mgnify:FL=1
MAWSITPTPGSEYLCADACQYRDCAEIRKIIASICAFCSKSIGVGVKLNLDEAGSPQHAVCCWKKAQGQEVK